jgi:hypothetical protein
MIFTIYFHLARKYSVLYGGPYHPIPLLKKDQYERIWWLILILSHHNLHMWYRVVYIGGIRVLLEILSRQPNRNIWFHHFKFFFISLWWYGLFFSNFKWKFSFQISMKIFKCFHFIFSWHISIFFISFWWSKTKHFNSNFESYFFSIFHFNFFGINKFFGPGFAKFIKRLQNYLFNYF